MGVVSWITRASSSSTTVQGRVSVKRWPLGPWASNTRDSPPLDAAPLDEEHRDQVNAVAVAPSGVGRPIPSLASMRN